MGLGELKNPHNHGAAAAVMFGFMLTPGWWFIPGYVGMPLGIAIIVISVWSRWRVLFWFFPILAAWYFIVGPVLFMLLGFYNPHCRGPEAWYCLQRF